MSSSPDTPSYEIFANTVYPLYSVALWFFRTLFGVDAGYFLLGLFQNLLLAISIFSLTQYIKNRFNLDGFTHCLLLLISALVFIVQKWLTHSGIISSNTLISEGLAFPLYLLFFRYILQAYLDHNRKAYLFACIFAAACILTRGQLYWLLVVVFLGSFCVCAGNRKRALLSAILICTVIVGFIQGSRAIQTSSVEDDQSKSPVKLYIMTAAVYCSEREDAALFPENSAEQQLFVLTRDWMDDPSRLASFSNETGNLTNRHSKFETYYDLIKGIINKNYKMLRDEGNTPNISQMTISLILAHPGSYLLHCAENALVGLIRTVAILKSGINIIAGLFYVYLLAGLLIFRKNEKWKSLRQMICLGLLCVLLNALVMGPGVFSLSRYVFYNIPIMYYSAILLLRTFILELRQSRLTKGKNC